MRWIALWYLTLLLIHTVLCWRVSDFGNSNSLDDEDGDGSSRYKQERRLLDYLRDVKRTDWFEVLCGKWDDWCLPDNSKPGLTCCTGYTCKCNLWNTNCRCKSKLFSGK